MEDKRIERPGFLPQKKIHFPEIPAKIGKIKKKDRWKSGSKIMDQIANDRTLYERLQEYREENWANTVKAFEANPTFYNAYQWLQYHPLFYWFTHGRHEDPQVHERYLIDDRGLSDNGLEFYVMRLDPETEAVSDDPARNTEVRFWYEVCITQWGQGRDMRVHDYKRDSGAPTYEGAVVKAAKDLHAKYGNDRAKFDKSYFRTHGKKPEQAPAAEEPKETPAQ